MTGQDHRIPSSRFRIWHIPSRAHYRPLIFTAGYVGLRWGELAGLRFDNVDPLHRTIKVVEQLVEVGGKVSWGPPKTRAGRRTVTMPAGVADMLAQHMASEVVQRSGLVFPTIQGHPMKRSNFRKLWGRALVSAGLSDLHFHELRHTAAALAIDTGAPPYPSRTASATRVSRSR